MSVVHDVASIKSGRKNSTLICKVFPKTTSKL